jgi:hypothetical protein
MTRPQFKRRLSTHPRSARRRPPLSGSIHGVETTFHRAASSRPRRTKQFANTTVNWPVNRLACDGSAELLPSAPSRGQPLRRTPGVGTAWFRVKTGWPAAMLYARRPNDDLTSFGRDLTDHRPTPPGTYLVKLPIKRGPWLVGCFEQARLPGGFSTFDHPDSDFDVVHVVKP